MLWNEIFPRGTEPSFAQIGEYIDSPYWGALNDHLQSTYAVQPKIEYSQCSGAPGWNVKYKKSGRGLCVLYPDKSFFTCLVCIGAKEAPEAELLIDTCTDFTSSMYWGAKSLNGSRWLMLKVTSKDILEDVFLLISTRVKKK